MAAARPRESRVRWRLDGGGAAAWARRHLARAQRVPLEYGAEEHVEGELPLLGAHGVALGACTASCARAQLRRVKSLWHRDRITLQLRVRCGKRQARCCRDRARPEPANRLGLHVPH